FMVSNEHEVLVLYGSQTGQSEAIAKVIEERCIGLDLRVRLFVLNDYERKYWIEKERTVVVVCSSTGDGDPPDNADRFVRLISRRVFGDSSLQHTEFALLGLGDSNYSTFQGTPRNIEKHLLRLGAKKFIETGVADDQIGLELAVEPWIQRLLEALLRKFNRPLTSLEKIFGGLSPAAEKNDPGSENNRKKVAAESEIRMIEANMSFEEADVAEEGGDEDEEQEVNEVLLKPVPLTWPNDKPCLVKASDALRDDDNLRVPIPAVTYIASRVTHEKLDDSSVTWQNGCILPGAAGEMLTARVVGTVELTYPGAGKAKRELQIDLGDQEVQYEPGDAFYFVVANPREEVNYILERMNLLMIADQKCIVGVDPQTEKRNASVPAYIPEISSLRYLLTYCLDIRRSPGRPLLRTLAEYASDPGEKRRLLELCSAQGNHDFTEFVRQAGLSLADILSAFPSCRPPIDRLLEHLPRLMPRPYSVTSCSERNRRRVRFAFSMLHFDAVDGRCYPRHGLASDWLASLRLGDHVKIILKEASRFRLPPPTLAKADARRIPLIMVGPGTGVAPYLSFLQHILEKSQRGSELYKVERELYFGCRQLDIDCIYRDELEMYLREGILSHLTICESQPTVISESEGVQRPKYVQEAIEARGKHICELLCAEPREGEERAVVYVCGDAKGMSKDVWTTFIRVVAKYQGGSEAEAKVFLEQLKKSDRYIEDVWA
uniref:Methionine synthase reductase n=1 Tax=Parascaris univalens TaxID=6257 RepID=A0A914ZRI6_PARUN